jgi:hypothetical protein
MSKHKMPFDLSKFTKTGGDKHSTVLTHKDGHSMTIVHGALSSEMRKAIESVPHKNLADGGNVASKGFSNPETQKNAEAIQRGVNQEDPIVSAAKNAWNSLTSSDNKAHGGKIVAKSPKMAQTRKEPGTPMVNQQNLLAAETQQPAPKMMADGGVATSDSSSMPVKDDLSALQSPSAQAAAPAAMPNAQGADPKAALYTAYNQVVTGSTDPASWGNFKGAVFGPNGEQPTDLNPKAAAAAQQLVQGQLAEKNAQTMQNVAHVNEDNQARQAFGMPQVPVPDALLKPVTAGASTSGMGGPAPASEQTQQGSSDPMGQGAYMGSYDKAVGEQKAGVNAEAAALGGQGQAEAEALQHQNDQQQQNINTYQDNFSKLNDERQNFIKDIHNQHIDPEHYVGSLSTAGKIATGIGLVLGGIGGGLTGQENPAYKMLQMHINNDIDAQKANLGKSENLLSANLHQFGNLRDATDMTRLQMNDLTVNKLKQAAAKAQTPLAKARALQAIGQIDQTSAQMHQQMAMRQTMMGMATGLTDPDKAAQTAATLRAYGNPEGAKALEEKIVPGVGVGQVPVPEAARQQIVASKNVNDLMNRSMEFSQKYKGSLDPAINAQASVIQNQLIGVIKQAQHDGVYKPSEAEFLTKQIGGSPTSFLANMSSVPKIQEMQRIKQQDYGQLLKTYGIRGPNTQLPGAQQEQAPAQYKTDAHGVKWMRGPNGKAIRVN